MATRDGKVKVKYLVDGKWIEFGDISNDTIHQPIHYTSHPSGIECIDITKHMNFCLGNAIKYIWRSDLKNDKLLDLKKAKEYLTIEINRLEALDSERNI